VIIILQRGPYPESGYDILAEAFAFNAPPTLRIFVYPVSKTSKVKIIKLLKFKSRPMLLNMLACYLLDDKLVSF
jgi:hypothetical protein